MQIAENNDALSLVALDALNKMTYLADFAKILENGNWQRLFNLLPEQLSEAPLSKFERALFVFFSAAPEALCEQFDQFNTIFQRGLVYLFNPITKTEVNLVFVCDFLVKCFAWLDEANPIEVDYIGIVERLLSIMNELKGNEQLLLKIFITLGIVYGTGRMTEDKYYKIRTQTLQDMLSIFETIRVSLEVMHDLVLNCFSVAEDCDESSQLVLENQKFVKCLFKCISNEHGNADLVPVLLSFCCSFPAHGTKCFMKHNFMKPVLFMLQSNASELQPDDECVEDTCLLLEGLECMLEEAENLVDGNEILHNPIALQMEETRGLKILKRISKKEECQNTAAIAKRLILGYFGEKWEEYLARRRGLKTKRAI